MGFIADHPIASAAILLGLLVLPAIGFAALRGLGLFRAVKASKATVEPKAQELMERAEGLQTEVERLTEQRLPAITISVESLQKSLAEVQVVARAATEGVGAATRPLRYLGR